MRYKDDEIVLLDHYAATPEEKQSWAATMRRGNAILKAYHLRAKAHIGNLYGRQAFRRDLFAAVKAQGGIKGGVVVAHKQLLPKNAKCVQLFNAAGVLLNQYPIGMTEEAARQDAASKGQTVASAKFVKPIPKIVKIGVSEVDLGLIFKVREIEFMVLSSFSRMIYRQADKWAKRKHGTPLEFADFYNIGTAAVISAIYGFTKEGIKLSTYFQHAIHRRILNETNTNKPLSAWPQQSKKLYGKFERTRNKMGMEVSFDEVVNMMNLNANEIADLRSMLTFVVNHSQVAQGNGGDEEEFLFETLAEVGKTEEPPTLTIDVKEAVARTPMSEIEKEVLRASQHDGRGWATEVANKFINPATGRPYSRRAPKLILDRVLARIRSNMSSSDAA